MVATHTASMNSHTSLRFLPSMLPVRLGFDRVVVIRCSSVLSECLPSQSSQKSNECFAVFGGESKAECMALHWLGCHSLATKATGYVTFERSPRIKPVFQVRYRATVLEGASIPQPFE